jgi:hypothetical protein
MQNISRRKILKRKKIRRRKEKKSLLGDKN